MRESGGDGQRAARVRVAERVQVCLQPRFEIVRRCAGGLGCPRPRFVCRADLQPRAQFGLPGCGLRLPDPCLLLGDLSLIADEERQGNCELCAGHVCEFLVAQPG